MIELLSLIYYGIQRRIHSSKCFVEEAPMFWIYILQTGCLSEKFWAIPYANIQVDPISWVSWVFYRNVYELVSSEGISARISKREEEIWSKKLPYNLPISF